MVLALVLALVLRIGCCATGPFFKGGLATTFGWVMAWPFETVKSRVQADMTGEYKGQSISKILRRYHSLVFDVSDSIYLRV